MERMRGSKALAAALLALVALGAVAASGQAATFTINSIADDGDAAPGNGICATAGRACTLRAAIMEANATPGADTIVFDPNAFSVSQTITLNSSLPTIVRDLTLIGPGASVLTVDANQKGSVFSISNGATAISDLTITGGKAHQGGGIYAHGTLLTLTKVTVHGNTADFGGGIFTGGPVVMNSSTVNGNKAARGGGIINYINGTLTINNSTISGNSAGIGGGIAASNYGNRLILTNSTVSYNSEGVNQQAGTVIMTNTILANNHGRNCRFQVQRKLLGALISRGHNLSTDNSCLPKSITDLNVSGGLDQPSDLNMKPAQLAPLALNLPGSTMTHALCTAAGQPDPSCVAKSPAIDAVPSAYCTDPTGTPITSDQRGVSRPWPPGGACDIGAYEVGVACVPRPPAMVAWWPLDETSGTTVKDVIGGHDGTAQPAPAPIGGFAGPGPVTSVLWPPPAFPQGFVNHSLSFSGQRHIEVPSHPDLEPGTGDFSIDAWVVYAASGSGQLLTVAQKNKGATAPFGNTRDGWRLVIRDFSPTLGGVSFRASIDLGGSVEELITPNVWHHVSATLSTDAGGVRIVKNYVDASSSGAVGLSGDITSPAPLLIGGDGIDGGQIAIDELEIFDRALTQPEIQALFDAGSAGKCR